MNNIAKQTPIKKMSVYSDYPCVRCGSKTKTGNVRREKMVTYSGISIIEHSDIICTNKICQKEFERVRIEEAQRYQDHKLAKEQKDHENALRLQANRIKKKKVA